MKLSTIAASLVLMGLVSALDTSSNQNVAVYWGQNSLGTTGPTSQQPLATYCGATSADIVILSFLNDYPDPLNLNFANQCGTTFSDGLLHCPQIGEDIKTCQAQGKKVLLSLGGAAGNYGFTSDTQASDFATTLWNKFGGGSDAERPFDDAVVDGFDFDSENNNQVGYVTLANQLRQLYSEDTSKSFYLSASPQCPYPDASVGDVLAQADLDFAFIQFYNNDCSLDKSFNWATWSKFAKSAPNPNMKLFVGLPAYPYAGVSGYVDSSVVKQTLDDIKCDTSLGGVSLWDVSAGFNNVNSQNVNYVQQIIDVLSEETCVASSSAAPSSAAPTSDPSSSAVVTSSPAITSSAASGYQNTTIASNTDFTATESDIKTTTLTITSCSDHKCTKVPVVTGLTTVTEGTTSYTTYCPLTGAETITKASTTVITITSCADNLCSEVPVTTGVTVVTELDTVYTTYCPLTSEAAQQTSEAAQPTGKNVVPTSFVSTSAPTTVAQVSVSQPASNQSSIASVETYIGAGNAVTGSWMLAIAAIVACIV